MRNFIFILCLMFSLSKLQATETKVVDGKVFFPKCVINNQYFWTQAEADSYQTAFATATVQSVTPSSTEIFVSTSIAKFKNNSEFKRCIIDTIFYLKVLGENRE